MQQGPSLSVTKVMVLGAGHQSLVDANDILPFHSSGQFLQNPRCFGERIALCKKDEEKNLKSLLFRDLVQKLHVNIFLANEGSLFLTIRLKG